MTSKNENSEQSINVSGIILRFRQPLDKRANKDYAILHYIPTRGMKSTLHFVQGKAIMKFPILIIGATVLLLVGGMFFLGKQPVGSVALQKNDAASFSTDHDRFDWGTISYDGGKASHRFTVTNDGTTSLSVANLKTSCMCTTVQFLSPAGNSPILAMHQKSSWQGTLTPGDVADIDVVFDPAYHGPQGVGPIERVVSFDTNDPKKPYVEFTLTGKVVK